MISGEDLMLLYAFSYGETADRRYAENICLKAVNVSLKRNEEESIRCLLKALIEELWEYNKKINGASVEDSAEEWSFNDRCAKRLSLSERIDEGDIAFILGENINMVKKRLDKGINLGLNDYPLPDDGFSKKIEELYRKKERNKKIKKTWRFFLIIIPCALIVFSMALYGKSHKSRAYEETQFSEETEDTKDAEDTDREDTEKLIKSYTERYLENNPDSGEVSLVFANDACFTLLIQNESLEKSYVTLSLSTGELLRLTDIFDADKDYLFPINDYLFRQMRSQVAMGEKEYFIDRNDGESWNFTGIDENASFYVDAKGNLCLTFREGDIAPIDEGKQEFLIPRKVFERYLK